ncbi:FAD-dependent oxidoreductase [Desulfopila sp. IMCC35008]|uniref:oxidoreductase n=1 Tax=Desulfopila sp. IMCC35008 TaxID=2653858 RepID=UPI0013D22A16|nr:FAD-dependent oxidoreductase [Desulfopila sp. IMCC35008]
MKDPLFQPWKINNLELQNRIFMPAMHLNMCHDFKVTEQLCDFYRRRAEGGVSLISVGYATVDEYSGTPGNIGAHHDSFIAGLTDLAGAIHEGGAKCGVQLNHAGRYNASFFLGGKPAVAPSPVPSRLTRETPRELDQAEIAVIIERFSDAAWRVQKTGFDMVEILAGTGYLISSFLSPLTNKRDDTYGGSLENRMRFGLEVIEEVRKRVGADFPLMVRINGNDFMEGGIGVEDLRTFSQALVAAGADALCVNVGWHEALVPQIVTKVPRGVFSYMAREIKDRVAVPVIASHRINDPETARSLLSRGFCDAVAVGRSLIADPDFPLKAQGGNEDQIVHCVACGQGCFDNIFKMKPVECLCNPQAGYEKKRKLRKTKAAKEVVVVGGGVAGMAAAMAASANGHRVRLFEKSMQLGGQLRLAGSAPGRHEFLVFAEDMKQRLAASAVEVMMNVEVDGNVLIEEKPDELIVATGGRPITPPIVGSEANHVIQAWDILSGKRQAGKKCVVIGGGAVGVETALKLAEEGTLSGDELKFLLVNQAEMPENLYRLATEGSREVTLVEMTERLGANFGKSTRWGMLQDIKRYGVKTCLAARVVSILPDCIEIELEGNVQKIEAETVVLAVGTASENGLVKVADELAIPHTLVGDASIPATVFEAHHQGYLAGWAI